MTTKPSAWNWVASKVLIAVHDEQLAEHGGLIGLRDGNALASAVARAQQLASYGAPDFAELAASYGFGIARNHPFSDGNKRTAFVAVELFLLLNGFELTAGDGDCVLTIVALADGTLQESEFAVWVRGHSKPR